MPIANCVNCGKLFPKTFKSICPACLREEEESFVKVRNFVREFPGVTLETVVGKTGVPESKVIKFIREGRLDTTEMKDVVYPCLICDAPIQSGKVCPSCENQINQCQSDPTEEKNTNSALQRRSGFFINK